MAGGALTGGAGGASEHRGLPAAAAWRIVTGGGPRANGAAAYGCAW